MFRLTALLYSNMMRALCMIARKPKKTHFKKPRVQNHGHYIQYAAK
jgi:hypothetical protein